MPFALKPLSGQLGELNWWCCAPPRCSRAPDRTRAGWRHRHKPTGQSVQGVRRNRGDWKRATTSRLLAIASQKRRGRERGEEGARTAGKAVREQGRKEMRASHSADLSKTKAYKRAPRSAGQRPHGATVSRACYSRPSPALRYECAHKRPTRGRRDAAHEPQRRPV